uniref:Zinc transporter 2 n=1 Tax=Rhabditophanes sp. KR3021 TaxID=114890 RepID=A0AC35TVG2_9BILA
MPKGTKYGSLNDETILVKDFDESYQNPGGDIIEKTSGLTTNNDFHCHSLSKEVKNTNIQAKKVLLISLYLCTFFMVIEVIGGYLAQSLSVVSDAAHLLTDIAAMLISLFSIYLASRPKSQKMSFGWHRAEVLGAFGSVILIWIVTFVLVYFAIQRIVTKEYEVDGVIMSITAAIGVVVNIIMGLVLYLGGHAHSHLGGSSHSHEPSAKADSEHGHSHGEKKESGNINIRATLIHVIGDLIQSIGVLIGGLVIWYNPDWAIIDSICTLLSSVIVLFTTFYITKDAVMILLEGIPNMIDYKTVLSNLASIEGVRKVHDLRIWSLAMDKIAISVHLEIDEPTDAQETLRSASILLKSKFHAIDTTIQIERFQPNTSDCERCVTP